MNIDDIYEWLMETDPIKDNNEIRLVWSNMASYCYFINTLDFDNKYKDKLIKLLDKSKQYDVSVPDKDHAKVLRIAKEMTTNGNGDSDIKQLLHG